MICHYCQKNVPQGAAFCPACGHRTTFSKNIKDRIEPTVAEQEIAKIGKTKRRITLKQILLLALAIICAQVTIGLIVRLVQKGRMERYQRQLEGERKIDEHILQEFESGNSEQMQRELNRIRNSNRESRSNYGGQW